MRVAWLVGVLALATAALAFAGGFAKRPALSVGVKGRGHVTSPAGNQLPAEVQGERAQGIIGGAEGEGFRRLEVRALGVRLHRDEAHLRGQDDEAPSRSRRRS